jgi:hypothetical protein
MLLLNLLRAVILRTHDHLLRCCAPNHHPGFDVTAEVDPGPEARESRFLRLRREVIGLTREEVTERRGVEPRRDRVWRVW